MREDFFVSRMTQQEKFTVNFDSLFERRIKKRWNYSPDTLHNHMREACMRGRHGKRNKVSNFI